VRLVLEVLVFGGAALALAATGLQAPAVVLAAAAAGHLTLTAVLGQR
jgi:hypothetical protein